MEYEDDAVALAACLFATDCLKRPKRKHRTWCKDWLRKRENFSHVNRISESKFAAKDFYNYLGMDEGTYSHLLQLVTPLIKKQDTVMRCAITPHERLTATLRFLATGMNYAELKFTTIISPQALGRIIPETCDAIYRALQEEYLKFPRTEEEWKNTAKVFEERWNFPHCLGAVDGKHVAIMAPHGSGSEYLNYKGKYSMVLLAVVDANYKFIMCDVRTNGKVSDGGLLTNTNFYQKLEGKSLNIPEDSILRNSSTEMPYVFVGEDAFPLRVDFMKPFREGHLNSKSRKIFNYRLSRVRRIVENAFGILASRFRIFNTKINLKPNNTESVVMACCVLHNFLMQTVPSSYAPPDCFDRENTDDGTTTPGFDTQGSLMIGLDRNKQGGKTASAKQVREKFMHYFENEGQVPWQDRFI